MTIALVNEIAADVVANLKRNPNGFTAETLVKNWESRIAWLELKVGGQAWVRELVKVARAGWIATTQKTTVFIPPSEETLNWGGFLGGEYVSTEEMRMTAEEAFVAKFGAVA
ncbi:hypothetical protein EVC03_023 [Rhizobium phage RHph_Y5A]|nr:hypothetical protein EVC03_023 [Rhizobium phage RHph_Y5A]QIG75465.1 hypothetical protein EVC18_023 [Rhizobium phage RHph_Y2_4]